LQALREQSRDRIRGPACSIRHDDLERLVLRKAGNDKLRKRDRAGTCQDRPARETVHIVVLQFGTVMRELPAGPSHCENEATQL
jgi:hypothetical protein